MDDSEFKSLKAYQKHLSHLIRTIDSDPDYVKNLRRRAIDALIAIETNERFADAELMHMIEKYSATSASIPDPNAISDTELMLLFEENEIV